VEEMRKRAGEHSSSYQPVQPSKGYRAAAQRAERQADQRNGEEEEACPYRARE